MYRKRTLPLKDAKRKILDHQVSKAESEYVFTMRSGGVFRGKLSEKMLGRLHLEEQVLGIVYLIR